MQRQDSLYCAVKDVLDLLLHEGITGHELEALIRMEIEDALQAVIEDSNIEMTGLAPLKIKIGNKNLTRSETIQMLTEGIPHPKCLSIDKIAQGLTMYLSNNLPERFLVSENDGTVTIILDEAEISHIFIDSEKIHIFHGANIEPTDLAAIQHMSVIFPTICEFINTMEEVKITISKNKRKDNNDTSPDDDDPSFDWV